MSDEESLWNVSPNFEKASPAQIVKDIVASDLKIYRRACSEFPTELVTIDRGLALFVEGLQAASKDLGRVRLDPGLRASIAMAISLVNYLFLARHALLLGYFPELPSIYRACHERITRMALFFAEEDSAKAFLRGKKIEQKDVDSKLSNSPNISYEPEVGVFNLLRKRYGKLSRDAHPNLESLQFRLLAASTEAALPSSKVEAELGSTGIIGGVLSRDIGMALLVQLLGYVVQSLDVFGKVVREGTGQWDKDFREIESLYKKWRQSLEKQR